MLGSKRKRPATQCTGEVAALLLTGKRVLVLGLMDNRSLAWSIGRAADAEGAEVIYGCQRERIVRGFFRRSGADLGDAKLVEVDVTDEASVTAAIEQTGAPLHGLVFSVAFASPETCLGGRMDTAPVQDVLTALHVSAVALATVCRHAIPAMTEGGSIVALSFDSQHSYPGYNWMGVAKAALEALVRGLQRDYGPLGVRVNTLSAGPQETLAASHIPGFAEIASIYTPRAPLGWNLSTSGDAVGRAACLLLSDLAGGIGGTVLTVDGGAHAMGAPLLE
jgi:enoyl-[acyl-carrier-protein] reductase (NADH)